MGKTHPSWDLMQPNENEKYHDFRFEEYYKRILTNGRLNHIPKAVFEQWIYYHHQEPNTLKNYAWMNYEKIEFNIYEWQVAKFEEVNVIKDFKEYFLDRSSYSDLREFCCTPKDLEYWKKKGPGVFLQL